MYQLSQNPCFIKTYLSKENVLKINQFLAGMVFELQMSFYDVRHVYENTY